jgi:uncharacterized caspase-like protein/nuclear transport factor 2 (NTF2) superfamily protein
MRIPTGFAVFLLAITICGLWLRAAEAQEKRVALVIGNAAYQHGSKLLNPKNDATDMAASLRKLGFQVIAGFDLTKPVMDRTIRDFAMALQGADVGLFYYAGHGLQVSGQNYLVPVEAELSSAAALDFEMVRLDLIHRTMEREASTNIIFLDACRDNPLARNLARALGTRSVQVGRGLAAVESGSGTLISFSTQPGNVASDGTGRNSPFTKALVDHITKSSDDLSAILISVRNDVISSTQRRQVPWEHSALTKRVYFNWQKPIASQIPVVTTKLSEAAEAWSATKDVTNVATLEAFASRYKETFYAELARARISELAQKHAMAVSPPTVTEAGPKPKPHSPSQSAPPAPPINQITPIPIQRTPIPLNTSEEQALKPGETFRECNICPVMVVIPPGYFLLTSGDGEKGKKPARKVEVSKKFAVAKFEATFLEWDACIADSVCVDAPNDQGWGRNSQPVINVTFNTIVREYLPWLSRKTGKDYRLLTEIEWEYAARAGSRTQYAWGDEIGKSFANCNGCGGKWDNDRTAPVGSFQSNAFGLHDMHGNIWEFVSNCFGDISTSATSNVNATSQAADCTRVLRGGSWAADPTLLRANFRLGITPSSRSTGSGFRVSRALE